MRLKGLPDGILSGIIDELTGRENRKYDVFLAKKMAARRLPFLLLNLRTLGSRR